MLAALMQLINKANQLIADTTTLLADVNDKMALATASDTLLASADTERSTGSDVPFKLKEIIAYHNGVHRIKFDLKAQQSTSAARGQIYKNGVAVGTSRSTTSTSTYVTFSEDIRFAKGDAIELYVWDSTNWNAYTRNLRVYYTKVEDIAVSID